MQGLAAALPDREEQDEAGERDRDRERDERAERVHVVGACQLNSPSKRVRVPAALDKSRRDGQAHEREPGQCQRVDPAEHPQPRHADGQKRKEADGERDADVFPPVDRPDERERTGIGRGQHEWTGDEDDDDAIHPVEVRRRDEQQGRPDAERQRRPEARPVEADRLGDELADGARLRGERRWKLGARHSEKLAGEALEDGMAADPVDLQHGARLLQRLQVGDRFPGLGVDHVARVADVDEAPVGAVRE